MPDAIFPEVSTVPGGQKERARPVVLVDQDGSAAGNELPVSWASPSTAFDARLAGDVEVQLVGAITTPYTPQRSLDGTNFVACNAYDKDGAVLSAISAPGIYSLDGGGYLKLTGGAGITSATIRVGA